MLRRIFSALGFGAPDALDPDAFTRLALSIFQKHAPNHKIEIVAPLQFSITPPEGGSQTVFLDNLYMVCQSKPRAQEAEISRFAKLMVEGIVAEVILPKNIVPLVRDASAVGDMEEHLTPETGKPKPKLAMEPLGADLVIIYVADNPQTIQYLTTDAISEIHLVGQTLRELAVHNLNTVLADVKSEGANGFFLFLSGRIVEETDSRIKIVSAGPKEEVIAKSDIASKRVTDNSVMPEGLEQMPEADFRNLIMYILRPPQER